MNSNIKPVGLGDAAGVTVLPRDAEKPNPAAARQGRSLNADQGKLGGLPRRDVEAGDAGGASRWRFEQPEPSSGLAHDLADAGLTPEQARVKSALRASTRPGSPTGVVVVAYSFDARVDSPEAAELFRQLEHALDGGRIPKGSTLAFHVPPDWLGEDL